MGKAFDEANEEFSNYDEWDEMNEEFYSHLRERFGKGLNEIGHRLWKSYQNKMIPMQLMVIQVQTMVVRWFNGFILLWKIYILENVMVNMH